MALNRDEIKLLSALSAPATQEEPVPALGGNVLVRGFHLEEQLANGAAATAVRALREGESAEQAAARANGAMAIRMVSQAVVQEDGTPLLTAAEWSAFSVRHAADVLRLANVAMSLSGQLEGEAEKN